MNNLSRVISADLQEIVSHQDLSGLRGKRVLITGATGMLAGYLVFLFDYLNETAQYGIQMTLLLRSVKKAQQKFGALLEHPGVSLLVQDVCQPIQCNAAFDYIIHGASLADPHSIAEKPFEIIRANTVGTSNLCALARPAKSRILFLSTREVYGSVPDAVALQEDMCGLLDHMDSRSCYPESKRCAEAMLLANGAEYDVPWQIVRIAHAYGPGMPIENDGRVMSDMIHDLVHQMDVVLKSQGYMLRSFCYLSDAVAAILRVLLCGEVNAIYNVANEHEEISVRDLAALVAQKAGTRVVFQLQSQAENARGYLQIPRVRLDTSRLEALGWRPLVSLSDGINRTYRFFNE